MDSLVNLFSNEHGKFSRVLQFEVVVFCVAAIIFFNVYFDLNHGYAIALLSMVIYASNVYVKFRVNKLVDFNKSTLYKLDRIQEAVNKSIDMRLERITTKISVKQTKLLYETGKLDYLYLDATMINFLYSIIPLHEYNPHEFYIFVKGVNAILRLRGEIEQYFEENGIYPQNTSEMLQTAIQLKSNTLNNLHNFIYSVPKDRAMYDYIRDATDIYNVLITRSINFIYTSYKNNIKQRGVNSSTSFVNYTNTKYLDPTCNHPISSTKEPSKLVSFYN